LTSLAKYVLQTAFQPRQQLAAITIPNSHVARFHRGDHPMFAQRYYPESAVSAVAYSVDATWVDAGVLITPDSGTNTARTFQLNGPA